MERILDVAQFLFLEYRKLSGEALSEPKLHQLLYFAQREAFAVTGRAMFSDELQGWRCGPGSPAVRSSFTKDGIAAKTGAVGEDAAYILKNVLHEYGTTEAWQLGKMSRGELSWRNARAGLAPGEIGSRPLSLEDIQRDAERVRPYDHVWDMYYDEFDL